MHTSSTHNPGVSSVVGSRRVWIVAVAGVLALAGVLFILLATGSVTSGGPNDNARGIAAATAAGRLERGVVLQPGGPNETARAAAAATTAGVVVIQSGGPDETARGAAVQSAATR